MTKDTQELSSETETKLITSLRRCVTTVSLDEKIMTDDDNDEVYCIARYKLAMDDSAKRGG